jgi:hypothetical protein
VRSVSETRGVDNSIAGRASAQEFGGYRGCRTDGQKKYPQFYDSCRSCTYVQAATVILPCEVLEPRSALAICTLVRSALLPGCSQCKNRGTPCCILQNFYEWVMLGSNQRPPLCEVRSLSSVLFASVQKLLQIDELCTRGTRVNLPALVY